MRQRQEQRALVVAGREQAVCATSKGSEWLNDAQQEVLAGAARRPTVVERVRIVGAVEDRIETYLAAREESLAATSTGSLLLRAEYGEGGSASSPQQSFAKREAAIARVAQQVDEELEAREETLRSMPLGRQYLSAAEQARAGGASGPPTPAERESMVRAAEQRVREELDRREERVLADTGDGRLLVDAAEELTESGAIIGDGGLTERTQIIGRAEGLLEEERAELKLKEADLLEDAAGEELLHKARLDVLGAADREAQTLADSWAVINQAAERKWEGQWTARVEALDNQLGGMDLYHAHLADIDPKWGADRNATTTRGNKDAALSAAESDGARLARLRGVLSAAAAARYREVLDDSPDRFNTTDLDRALAAGEREREEREAARLAAALETATAMAQAAAARSNVKLPDVRVIYETGETHAAGLAAVERTTQALDDAANQRLPADTVIHTWNANRSDPGGIAAALDAATAARREEERAAAAAARVERQLEALTARTGAARLAQRNGNSLRPVSEKIPPVRKLPRRVPDATREDAELVRALKDLENATEPGRLAQRNGNSLRPVDEKSPPVPKPDRLVPDATREDAVAAAPLIRGPPSSRPALRPTRRSRPPETGFLTASRPTRRAPPPRPTKSQLGPPSSRPALRPTRRSASLSRPPQPRHSSSNRPPPRPPRRLQSLLLST